MKQTYLTNLIVESYSRFAGMNNKRGAYCIVFVAAIIGICHVVVVCVGNVVR